MRKTIHKYISSVLAASFILIAGSCDPNEVESLSFNVRTEGDVTTVKTDDEIHFLIDGNADYITFYSGEDGSCYDNRERTEAEIAGFQGATTFRAEQVTADLSHGTKVEPASLYEAQLQTRLKQVPAWMANHQ